MAISLWFAIYILARSPANPVTFRAVVALLSLAFYYNNSFVEMVNAENQTGAVRSLAMIIALIAAHDLTHYLLPRSQREKLYWVARSIVFLGVVSIVLLFTAPPGGNCGPGDICPSNFFYPWVVIDFFKILFLSAILYNLWLIKKSEGWVQNVPLYGSVLLAGSTIGYGMLGTVFNLVLPRLISNLMMLAALILLVYSVAQNKTFITHRSAAFEVPITMTTVAAIVGIYILFAFQIGLSSTDMLLLAVLAIFTHSTYDFVRELLDRWFERQEHLIKQELRHLGQDISSDQGLQRFLQRSLAILCYNLRAANGFIAINQGERYQIVASLHSLPVGSSFSAEELPANLNSQISGSVQGSPFWLVPAFVGSEQVVVIGVGARKDRIQFSEEDIFWMEDIAEEISLFISSRQRRLSSELEISEVPPEDDSPEPEEGLETEELLTKLVYKLDPETVKCVEDGFRNLKDYSILGKSPLATMLAIQAKDHIERGKCVQRALIEMLEKLRPAGDPPCEPLPREWYAYTILHDAYLEERLTREIMAKLYISEGTYFRMRRHALRVITRVLLETSTTYKPN
jgi:hypothetical protein